MNLKTLFISVFLLFFQNAYIYSQSSPRLEPVFWLSNSQKINTSFKEFNTLNFHSRLFMDNKSIWSSTKKTSKSNYLFVVYKSRKNENLVSFIGNEQAVFVDGKNMFIRDSVDLNGYNEPYGELLDARFSNGEEGTFWMNPQLEESALFELILVDKKISTAFANEIRTYLGLKYGISLIDHKQYTYHGKSLWEGTDKKYNHQIFGLAHMSYFNLMLSRSIHSQDKDLIVSLASPTQKSSMNEGAYVLFGNNRKPLVFNKKTKFSEKQWLVQTNKEEVKVDVSFPLSSLRTSSDTFNEYELLTNGAGSLEVSYKGRLRDTLLVFRNVTFGSKEHTEIKLKEHKSDFKWETDNDCERFRLKLKSSVKLDDFEISLTDDTGKKVLIENTFKEIYEIPASKSSYFEVSLSYNGKQVSRRIETLSGSYHVNNLQDHYVLEEGKSVTIRLDNPDHYTFNWFNGSTSIGTGNEIKLEREGSYTLKVTGREGCTAEKSFSVRSSLENEQWRVFPNPADVSADIYVSFNLPQEAAVELALYQIDGKFVKKFPVGTTVRSQTINLGKIALAPGVYMIVAYIDQLPQFKKIIIK